MRSEKKIMCEQLLRSVDKLRKKDAKCAKKIKTIKKWLQTRHPDDGQFLHSKRKNVFSLSSRTGCAVNCSDVLAEKCHYSKKE